MRPLALALIVAALAARQAGFHSWILICHCDAFAMGGLLAWSLGGHGADGPPRVLARRLALLGTACVFYLTVALPLLGGRPFDEECGPWALNLSVVAAFFASLIGVVVLHAGHPALAPLRTLWLTWLGTMSYVNLYQIAVLLACAWLLLRLGLPTIVAPLIAAPLNPGRCRSAVGLDRDALPPSQGPIPLPTPRPNLTNEPRTTLSHGFKSGPLSPRGKRLGGRSQGFPKTPTLPSPARKRASFEVLTSGDEPGQRERSTHRMASVKMEDSGRTASLPFAPIRTDWTRRCPTSPDRTRSTSRSTPR